MYLYIIISLFYFVYLIYISLFLSLSDNWYDRSTQKLLMDKKQNIPHILQVWITTAEIHCSRTDHTNHLRPVCEAQFNISLVLHGHQKKNSKKSQTHRQLNGSRSSPPQGTGVWNNTAESVWLSTYSSHHRDHHRTIPHSAPNSQSVPCLWAVF